MKELTDNNQNRNLGITFTQKIANNLVENVGGIIYKIIGILITIIVALYIIKHPANFLSIVDFDLTNPEIFLPLGASAGLVVFMTAFLSTPVSVAIGVSMLIYLLISSIL